MSGAETSRWKGLDPGARTSHLLFKSGNKSDGLLEHAEFRLWFLVAHVQRHHPVQLLERIVNVPHSYPADGRTPDENSQSETSTNTCIFISYVHSPSLFPILHPYSQNLSSHITLHKPYRLSCKAIHATITFHMAQAFNTNEYDYHIFNV